MWSSRIDIRAWIIKMEGRCKFSITERAEERYESLLVLHELKR